MIRGRIDARRIMNQQGKVRSGIITNHPILVFVEGLENLLGTHQRHLRAQKRPRRKVARSSVSYLHLLGIRQSRPHPQNRKKDFCYNLFLPDAPLVVYSRLGGDVGPDQTFFQGVILFRSNQASVNQAG